MVTEGNSRELTINEHIWLHENGGSGEGIILSGNVFGSRPDIQGSLFLFPMHLTIRTPVHGKIGEQISPPHTASEQRDVFRLRSLLVPAEPALKENWPGFLYSSLTTSMALAGVHYGHFERLVRFHPAQNILAVVSAFSAIDILSIDYSKKHPGREITVITKDGERTLVVSEDWERRLYENRPFHFHSWNEVFDLIES